MRQGFSLISLSFALACFLYVSGCASVSPNPRSDSDPTVSSKPNDPDDDDDSKVLDHVQSAIEGALVGAVIGGTSRTGWSSGRRRSTIYLCGDHRHNSV